MLRVNLMINNETGLHARPAALFAQTAQQFKSKMTISHAGNHGDAKSVLNILGLGICKGTEILVEADGIDEKDALKALQNLVDSNFTNTQFLVNDPGRKE